MTARDVLRAAAQRLRAAGVASPESDAATLLGFVLGVPRLAVPLADDPTPQQVAAYDALVARRTAREPLQHLTGVAGFRTLELRIGPGAFVPRPETELLAGWAIAAALKVQASGRTPVVVDLCTGSGAIAAAVSAEVPGAEVHAYEIDPSAHAWAEVNLASTGVRLVLADLSAAADDLSGCVDVVVCNPPYIPLEAWESVEPEVRDHDPALALWSGDDGLDAMRVLERTASVLLVERGVVGAEHADAQEQSAPAVFAGTGRWYEVRDHRDLAGRPRYVTARRALGG